MEWQLQEAKNRFSEVVQRARSEGPQIVTLRGERAVIVVAAKDYDTLTAKRPSLADYILSGPAWPDDLVETINTRSKSPGRGLAF
ncbi:MAG: type II toxin-antitoxin system Phd/YefM family antitoxin [Beijerinckiaceae bacterium]|nr:type II toxin-antitoxin system Phd/YefM family antitoxin [Beijerinckiaceae bacterium]